ncbi:MAG: isoprenylcysteine carboxylmethyltransferase family protein [Planctomycetes bacterium]|nr:isoprenylcysteine carboxylmethyltransferase family protein [Planctomycetota bacterium]
MKSLHKICFSLRAYLISFPVIIAIFVSFAETENNWIIWPVGGGLFLIGFAIRIWSQQHLHYRMKIRKHMTTTGPYAIIRNPIYVGNVLMATGAVVTSELVWFAPCVFAWGFLIYGFAVKYEEAYLIEKFGAEYADYAAKTPGWFPNGKSNSELQLVNSFFFKVMLKEAHCVLMLVPFVLKETMS